MFVLEKQLEIAGSHSLKLPYKSKCRNKHGHNWKITVVVEAEELNSNGMVVDFTHIKKIVNRLDHTHLNNIFKRINPTAENIAKWIADKINKYLQSADTYIQVKYVSVQESEGNTITYYPPTE